MARSRSHNVLTRSHKGSQNIYSQWLTHNSHSHNDSKKTSLNIRETNSLARSREKKKTLIYIYIYILITLCIGTAHYCTVPVHIQNVYISFLKVFDSTVAISPTLDISHGSDLMTFPSLSDPSPPPRARPL